MEKNKIVESFERVVRPGHYLFKIKSFSLLAEVLRKTPGVESYETPAFDAGGHKWKLSFFPNGNKKTEGDDHHVSLYLVAADNDIDTGGAEINAMFKLFLMDQHRDEYLTFQDGVVRRFHGLKKEWGFNKLIPLNTLKNAANGYLVDDCLVFGVEILVIPSKVKSECFSLIENPLNGTYTWKVDNFSGQNELSLRSESFTVEGHEWKLRVDLYGEQKVNGEYLSIYLIPEQSSFQSKVYVDFDLIVKDQFNGNHKLVKYEHWFNDAGVGFGSPKFMKMSDLKDKSKGFLVNDSVVFEVKISVISKVADT